MNLTADSPTAKALAILFALLLFSPVLIEAWELRIDGRQSSYDQAHTVAVDADDNVFAAGHISGAFTVSKFSGAAGEELWRATLRLEDQCFGEARALAVDSSGDVIAAGRIESKATANDFAVAKFSGVDGSELWRAVIDGAAELGDCIINDDQALAVAVDGAGDVVAAGFLRTDETPNQEDFAVIKLSGVNGRELWRLVIHSAGVDKTLDVAVDAVGDVLAAGDRGWVVKLSGITGAVLWLNLTAVDGSANAVAVDAAGDLFAAGGVSGTGGHLEVSKLAGDEGRKIWTAQFSWTISKSGAAAQGVATDVWGDVVAVGGPFGGAWVKKLSGATGSEIWQGEYLEGPFFKTLESVVVDPSGDVVAAGQVPGSAGDDFAIIKFSGSDGIEMWRAAIASATPGWSGRASAVAVDGSGHVAAAGFIESQDRLGDLTAAKYSAGAGMELWRRLVDGSESADDVAFSATLDAAGDVLAAGTLDGGFTLGVVKISGTTGTVLWLTRLQSAFGVPTAAVGSDALGDAYVGSRLDGWFTVVKLSGQTGEELWRAQITDSFGWVRALAVDASGDVVAAGDLLQLEDGSSHTNLAAVKLQGATGEELWRRIFDGSAARSSDSARSVAVDASSDVLVAGWLSNAGTFNDFTVLKLSGTDGSELWSQVIDGPSSLIDAASSLAVDDLGNVVAAGRFDGSGQNNDDFFVIKLSGPTGDEVWRARVEGSEPSGVNAARAVGVDAAGDVIAAGGIENAGSGDDFFVIKLSGNDGSELWSATTEGSHPLRIERALSLAIDEAGDPIVAGALADVSALKFAIVKYSSATGAELWRHLPDFGTAYSVALDDLGHVVAAGEALRDFLVTKLDGDSGLSLGPCGSPEDLVLSHRSVDTTEAFEACYTLAAGPDFQVVSPGQVTFRAGQSIVLRDGFSVAAGARFVATIDPSLAN